MANVVDQSSAWFVRERSAEVELVWCQFSQCSIRTRRGSGSGSSVTGHANGWRKRRCWSAKDFLALIRSWVDGFGQPFDRGFCNGMGLTVNQSRAPHAGRIRVVPFAPDGEADFDGEKAHALVVNDKIVELDVRALGDGDHLI